MDKLAPVSSGVGGQEGSQIGVGTRLRLLHAKHAREQKREKTKYHEARKEEVVVKQLGNVWRM